MANFVLLGVCFSLGALARRFSGLGPEAPRVLNLWVIWAALPALVVRTVHTISFEPKMLVGTLGLWLILGLAIGAAVLAVRRGWADRSTAGAVLLCAGLGNTVYIGLPLIEAIAGRSAMETASVIDQLGTFLALSTVAVPVAMLFSGQTPSALAVVRKVLTFPPFLAMVTGVALRGVALPAVVETVLSRLSDTLTPMTLVALGFQWSLSSLQGLARPMVVGLGYKLVLAPVVMWLLMFAVDRQMTLITHMSVLQAAMAPMLTAGVLAEEFNLRPALASSLIAVGTPLSFLTVPLWHWLLSRGGA